MKIRDIMNEDGRIVKGVNTTVDVQPGETERQAKKFFGGSGKPKPLGVKGATPHQAFNLGLVNESYKLQLERGDDMDILHILDTKTGHRTEVRGKPNFEIEFDPNDPLHKVINSLGKSANISDFVNGEVVTINPKHPDSDKAKAATDKAFNESKGGLPVKTLKGLFHVGTLDASKKRDGFEGAGLSVSTHPDAWKRIAKGHVTGDTYSATKEGNRILDAHSLTKEHNAEITQ